MTTNRVATIPFDMAGLATVNKEVLPQPPTIIASSIIAKVVIPGPPMSKQRPRFSRKTGAAFTPKETRDREHAIGQYVWAHGWRKPPDAERAFGIRAVFYVADQMRRDVDNMLKLVLDGLNKVVWADDSQVFEVMGWKREDAQAPRTELVVYSLGYASKRMATCAQCTKRYRSYPSWKHRQFCTARCLLAHTRTGEQAACGSCAKYVYRAKGVVSKNRKGVFYCSTKCLSAALTTTMNCQQCGSLFTRAKSLLRGRTEACCSVACSDMRRNARRRSVRKGDCEVCGGPVSRREYRRCILHRAKRTISAPASIERGVARTIIELEKA